MYTLTLGTLIHKSQKMNFSRTQEGKNTMSYMYSVLLKQYMRKSYSVEGSLLHYCAHRQERIVGAFRDTSRFSGILCSIGTASLKQPFLCLCLCLKMPLLEITAITLIALIWLSWSFCSQTAKDRYRQTKHTKTFFDASDCNLSYWVRLRVFNGNNCSKFKEYYRGIFLA